MTLSANTYLDIPDRRDSKAVGTALERTITGLQSGASYAEDRGSLVKALIDDLGDGDRSTEPIWKSWDVQTYEAALECIKVLSRSQAGSSYLASTTGTKVLQHHAQTPSTNSSSKPPNPSNSQHLAVAALCNNLLLHQTAPSICAQAGLGDWAVRELAQTSEGEGDEMWSFLMGRVIMVLTSRAGYGFLERMVDELSGLEVLDARLRDAIQHPERPSLALVEYLKTLYHVFALYPETHNRQWDDRFNAFSPLLIDLLLVCPTKRLVPPMTNIINILTRVPPESLRNTITDVTRLTKSARLILDAAMEYVRTAVPWKPGDTLSSSTFDRNQSGSLDEVLPPAFLALVSLVQADPVVKKQIKDRILPADLDRSVGAGPLEERADVLGYLLRLSRSALNHVTAAVVGELLYVVCDENSAILSDEIGYGNAAGILFHKGMGPPPKPEATIEEIPDEVDAPSDSLRNPITGLAQEADEPKHPMADMTQEEKECEAERMMALFDRMDKNPAMQLVDNPMKAAVRSGKIDEWERSEQARELQRIRKEEEADEAEAAKELLEWKKRMRKSS